MREDFRKKFVAALRSGDYVKITGMICSARSEDDGRKRCCAMGVAGYLMGGTCDGEFGAMKFAGKFADDAETVGLVAISRLPDSVIAAAGMTSGDQGAIMYLNDRLGLTFDEIADYVEDGSFVEKAVAEGMN